MKTADTETRLVGTGQGGEGGMSAVSNTETYTLPHVTLESQWKFAL